MDKQVFRRFIRNKSAIFGGFIVLFFVIIAIFGEYIAPFDPLRIDLPHTNRGPSNRNPLGTDNLGRDILSRMLYGAQISLKISISSVAMGAGTGMILGVLAGYYGNKVDSIIVGIIDVLLAFPGILLAIFVVAIFGTGIFNTILAIAVFSVPTFARIVRSSILFNKNMDYVISARALGANDFRIIFRHILPNSLSPIIVQSTLMMGTAILTASGLSFLGLGVQPPNPEWGSMLATARISIRSNPVASVAPGVAITLVVLSFSLLGDGLRDALDPKLKNR